MRLAIATCLLGLVVANDAAAATRSVARVPDSASVALAGDAVLLARRGRTVRVDRVPLDGVTPRSRVFSVRLPGADSLRASVAASPTLGALVVSGNDQRTGRLAAQEFAGPPAGPWSALGPVRVMGRGRFAPAGHLVEGDRLFTAEFRNFSAPWRWVVREPGSAPATIAVPRDAGADIAGDIIAISGPDSVTVRNWRTGAKLASYRVPDGVDWFDVRADGAVVISEPDLDIVERAPGATPRRFARAGQNAEYAGDRIVFVRTDDTGVGRLQVAEPDGRIRPFGVPSAAIFDFGADGDRVLWRANRCVLTAAITDPPASAPDPGVCARSEVALADEISPLVRRTRRVLVRVDCVAAPPPSCRGTLALRFRRRTISALRRFSIPVGRTEPVRTRLTRRGYARVARLAHRIGGAPVRVRTVAVDPDGRRRRMTGFYVLNVRRT